MTSGKPWRDSAVISQRAQLRSVRSDAATLTRYDVRSPGPVPIDDSSSVSSTRLRDALVAQNDAAASGGSQLSPDLCDDFKAPIAPDDDFVTTIPASPALTSDPAQTLCCPSRSRRTEVNSTGTPTRCASPTSRSASSLGAQNRHTRPNGCLWISVMPKG